MSQETDDDPRMRGVKSLNQQYKRYEQVTKNQTYGLSENAEVDRFDDCFEIGVCDMADWFDGGEAGRQRFARSLGGALEEIGFAILTNHGVDPQLYRQTDKAIREFFETIPAQARQPYLARRHGSVNQGYFPVNETTIIHPDQVEGWVFCRRAFNLDDHPDYNEKNFWPAARLRAALSPTGPGPGTADPADHAVHSRLPGLRSASLRPAPDGHQFRLPAQLLSAR